MPLKRTPPSKASAHPSDSEIGTDVEEVGCTLQGEDSATDNINTGRFKRKREPESPELAADLRKMFSKMCNEQCDRLRKMEDALGQIKSQYDNLNSLMDHVSYNNDELKKEIEQLRRERKDQTLYIQLLENKIENLERSSCAAKIEIRNIPQRQGETKTDMSNTVKNIGNAISLNIHTTDIRDIYRTYTKSNKNRPVVVEFSTVIMKENFISTIKRLSPADKSNKLNTSVLSLQGEKIPLFISEYLTAKDRRLFFLARDFAKVNEFSYCWTSNGRVFLRKREGQPQIRISDEGDLKKLEKNMTE